MQASPKHPDPLAVPLAKIEEARRKLVTLYQEVQGIFQSGPYTAVGEFDPQTGEHTIRAKRLAPLPLIKWGVQTGAIAHDCRSALNYVVTELVRDKGTIAPDRGHEFPIFDDPKLYAAKTKKGNPHRRSGLYKIRGIRPEAAAFIESLQPYHRPPPKPGVIQQSALWALHELNRVDKHQELILPEPVLATVGITSHSPTVVILEYKTAGPIEDNAVLIRWKDPTDHSGILANVSIQVPEAHPVRSLPTTDPDVPMHLHATFDVAFSEAGATEGGRVIDTLNQIVSRSRNTIEAFSEFFS